MSVVSSQAVTGGLRAEALSFNYGRRAIFSDVTFQIPQGEIWGLVGRSGIGKTTLLNIVLGLYQPSSGHVFVDGAEIVGPGKIRGAVFRDNSLLPWLTVLENAHFSCDDDGAELRLPRAKGLLEEAGLGARLTALPKELSAGMAKRVELIRAIVTDEKFFVADEPFATLDFRTRLELHRLWLRLHRSNPRTGILCTHDPAEALRLCHSVIVMRENGQGQVGVDIIPGLRAANDEADWKQGLDPETLSLLEMMG